MPYCAMPQESCYGGARGVTLELLESSPLAEDAFNRGSAPAGMTIDSCRDLACTPFQAAAMEKEHARNAGTKGQLTSSTTISFIPKK